MSEGIYINAEGDMTNKPAQPADTMLEKIKTFLSSHYFPTKEPIEADLRLTTDEIFSAIKRLHPDIAFSVGDLVKWLNEKGFDFYDAGQMRFEWLLKTAT